MVHSILAKLGLAPAHQTPGAQGQTSAAVEHIAERLQSLGTDRARFVAALAMVLGRAARADLDVSEDERDAIAELLVADGGMARDHAELVADMVAHHDELGGVAEDYLATRELKRVATREELESALHALFAVCAADDSISLVEEEEVRQTASELGFTHEEYVAARAEYRDQREVLRGLRRGGGEAR